MISLFLKSGISYGVTKTDTMIWSGGKFKATSETRLIGIGLIFGSLIYAFLKGKIKKETKK